MTDQSPDVVWQPGLIERAERWESTDQRGATVWFTGLSGSGKSTVAAAVERLLVADGRAAYMLDGDNIRHGLSGD
ncbi:MAG: adenylyl-sulfate kinase, partial [Acidimicrobiales bacterium]|nr:adenylyl-sulfate kinase [Acidimicrobiales bacterium]